MNGLTKLFCSAQWYHRKAYSRLSRRISNRANFFIKIPEKMPKTYAELKIKAFSHASVDEYIKGKKGEPSKQKNEAKRKEHDNAKDT